MSHDEWLDELRKARDATALERLLSQGLPDDGLQHAGDAILGACRGEAVAELDAVISALVEALGARGWDGDAELADALLAVTGRQPSKLGAWRSSSTTSAKRSAKPTGRRTSSTSTTARSGSTP